MCDYDVAREVRRLHQELRVYDVGGLTKIRIGRQGDGGYVVLKEPLEGLLLLYTYGVGDEMSFELDLLNRCPNASAVMCDPSIDELPELHPRAGFLKECFSPRTVIRRSMMKVDVEGAEWDILPMWSIGELVKLDQLIIEFHFIHAEPPSGLSPYFSNFYQTQMDKINRQLFTKYRMIIGRLNRAFRLFHVHVNNSLPPVVVGGLRVPPLVECSFVNRDLVPWATYSEETFPIRGLDFPNKPDRPEPIAFKPPEVLC
jgi:hypothetical protein